MTPLPVINLGKLKFKLKCELKTLSMTEARPQAVGSCQGVRAWQWPESGDNGRGGGLRVRVDLMGWD